KSEDADDGGIGTGKMLDAALRACTNGAVSGRFQVQRRPARRTKARARLPVGEAERVSEQAGFERRPCGARLAQSDEASAKSHRDVIGTRGIDTHQESITALGVAEIARLD